MANLNILNLFKIFISIFFYLFGSIVYANTYYVSSSNGDDAATLSNAQNLNTPWKTLAKVNAVSTNFKPGDSILLNRGDIFTGTLQINVSGTKNHSIVIAAYGNGQLPEITGFTALSNWQQKGNGIWEATVAGGLAYMNTVLVNGVSKAVGRYPNATSTEQGYLHFESANTNISITDSKLANGPNWSGGQIVIRKIVGYLIGITSLRNLEILSIIVHNLAITLIKVTVILSRTIHPRLM